jgi:phenylacetate-CoA ligase
MGKITGRSDDMLIIRGVNVFPSQIEELILRVPQLAPHYLLVLEKDGHLDCLTVRVELSVEAHAGSSSAQQLIARNLEHTIKNLIGVTVEVELIEPGGIERVTVGKAKRVLDRRPRH